MISELTRMHLTIDSIANEESIESKLREVIGGISLIANTCGEDVVLVLIKRSPKC